MLIQKNYDKSKRPIGSGYDRRVKSVQPSSIIVHTTNGNYGSSFHGECQYLYDSNSVSAHYIISKHGIIEQLLDPLWRAWHAGVTIDGYNNNQSIGIECHLTAGESWTQAMRDSLTWLVRKLMTDYAIPASRIETHRRVALPAGRKSDPVNWLDGAFYQWRNNLSSTEQPINDVSVIGVAQRATRNQIIGSLTRNRIALSVDEMNRFYTFCEWLEVRADFVIALMKHESDFGRQGVGAIANNVASVKTTSGDWRPKVLYKSEYWHSYQSIQLALFDLVGRILKNNYGATGKTTVGQIIKEYAPPSQNETRRYISSVLEDMNFICMN